MVAFKRQLILWWIATDTNINMMISLELNPLDGYVQKNMW